MTPTPEEVIDKYFTYNEFDKKRVIQAMQEYAEAYQKTHSEQKDKEIEELRNILDECRLQFEYLNGKFGETGTTNNILSKINTNKP